ncbi:hypothetical protein [Phytomonospora endophytica]|uniref:Lipoprotein LpqN n=1 Tax=Phytomonospora endophytica TaxID=714109 RepID=A0A841FSE1_9ACTN|nr:hypothetical protein [Phytomonospora endophytica]MBB6036668.1 hypothetical protein [Phytomonospora endophytica]GIG65990.1 hypothetical protein Pen01_22850 [Phytomonospora endophytica]
MPRWTRLIAAFALAVVALTACTSEDPPADPGAGPSSSGEVDPEGRLIVDFRMPGDFGSTSAVPLPMIISESYRTPDIIALKDVQSVEAIMVVSYALPQDFTGATDAELLAKISEYNNAAGVTPKGDPILAIANRHRGFVQSVEKAENGKTTTFEATYLFFGPNLVQVICQWDKLPAELGSACQTVLRSLKIK